PAGRWLWQHHRRDPGRADHRYAAYWPGAAVRPGNVVPGLYWRHPDYYSDYQYHGSPSAINTPDDKENQINERANARHERYAAGQNAKYYAALRDEHRARKRRF